MFCDVKLRLLPVLLLALASCHRGAPPTFVASLRCGMTRAEVTRLANELGYNPSDAGWLTRSAAERASRTKELTLLDLTFRNGRLVAFRQGTYDPRTKTIVYRTKELCR